MRSTISRMSWWCGAAVVALAAAGCSSDPVSPGADSRAGTPSLSVGTTTPPAGSTVTGRVAEARGLKKIGGRALLRLEFTAVDTPAGTAPISSRRSPVSIKSFTIEEKVIIPKGEPA